MKTLHFKQEYEQKLKRLRIKTKFTKLFLSGIFLDETLDHALVYINSMPSWFLFITGAFDFTKLSKEEARFWTEISMKTERVPVYFSTTN